VDISQTKNFKFGSFNNDYVQQPAISNEQQSHTQQKPIRFGLGITVIRNPITKAVKGGRQISFERTLFESLSVDRNFVLQTQAFGLELSVDGNFVLGTYPQHQFCVFLLHKQLVDSNNFNKFLSHKSRSRMERILFYTCRQRKTVVLKTKVDTLTVKNLLRMYCRYLAYLHWML
jgi:hypothetical protein